jgi:hypothetical protein
MGQVDLTQLVGNELLQWVSKPNEFSIDVAYGLKLSDSYSMAVTGRFIRSDLAGDSIQIHIKAANSFAVDVSGYYTSERFSSFGGYDGKLNAGLPYRT